MGAGSIAWQIDPGKDGTTSRNQTAMATSFGMTSLDRSEAHSRSSHAWAHRVSAVGATFLDHPCRAWLWHRSLAHVCWYPWLPVLVVAGARGCQYPCLPVPVAAGTRGCRYPRLPVLVAGCSALTGFNLVTGESRGNQYWHRKSAYHFAPPLETPTSHRSRFDHHRMLIDCHGGHHCSTNSWKNIVPVYRPSICWRAAVVSLQSSM